MKKRSNSKSGLSSEAEAWLRGEECGFYQFKNDDDLEALWLEHGDHDSMFWRRGMISMPITLEHLETIEDGWLNGEPDYFIRKHYSDEEKIALFNERGDKTRFHLQPGAWGLEPRQIKLA